MERVRKGLLWEEWGKDLGGRGEGKDAGKGVGEGVGRSGWGEGKNVEVGSEWVGVSGERRRL